MPRYKVLLIFMLIILLLFALVRSDYFSSYLKQLTGREYITTLPAWLSRSHRLSGPYAFDYIPLDLDQLSSAEEPDSNGNNAPASGGSYVNPSGSPYPPGTLADMIWQQKQQDQRYGN